MAQAHRTSPVPPGPAAGERQRVLVVDRALELIAPLAAALGPDCEVGCLGNGDEALEAALAQMPDLVLINVGVAEIDGFALAARLLADPRTQDKPILLRSDAATAADEERGLRLGAIDFISRPANPELALRIANHLRRQRRHEQIRSLSATDEETGLGNRRSLEDSLVREWHRAQRQGTALSLVLVHPHHGEAESVKRIAKGLRAALHRPGDVVTRYGANTFAAILTQTDAIGAEHVVCRIRAAIGNAAIGAVTRVPQVGEDPVVLLRLADERLRRVKRAETGRIP